MTQKLIEHSKRINQNTLSILKFKALRSTVYLSFSNSASSVRNFTMLCILLYEVLSYFSVYLIRSQIGGTLWNHHFFV